jgi:serine/threonine protein kinase/Flp pilus assembly protein TadD
MKPKPRYQEGDKIGGRYLVHQALMGSMGEVYLCLDLERNYPFALKTFQSRFLKRRKIQDAFYTEVATWVALEKHPNVVRCFYMDSIDNRPFMFLEWIASDETKGTDLRSWLRRSKLSPKLALTYASDICRGLIHAAQKQPGIVHRDIKPENILVAQGQVAKITDFGLASIVKATDLSISESDGQVTGRQSMVGSRGVVGTPAYMAPEQWRSEEPDVRTDIYAVGCIIYEMLTGKLPFMAKDLEGFLQAHLIGPIPKIPPSEEIPRSINRLIEMCMAKKRDDRFATVTDLLSALSWVHEEIFKEPPRELEAAGGFSAVDYNYRGVTYDKLDKYDEAVADYSRALELDMTFVMAYNNRGATYERLRKYDEALIDYSSAIQQAPTMAPAYYNRGNVFSKKKRSIEAIEDFTRALQIDPALMRAYINRGSEYYMIDRYHEALEDFTAAIELEPSYAKAHVNRGVIYDSLKQFDRAIEDYTHAIRLAPHDPAIYYNRGLSYYNMEQYERAIQDFSKVLEMMPDDTQALYLRALSYSNLGRYPEAMADHETVVKLDKSPAMTSLNEGAIKYLQGDLKGAIANFHDAASLGDKRAGQWVARIESEIRGVS